MVLFSTKTNKQTTEQNRAENSRNQIFFVFCYRILWLINFIYQKYTNTIQTTKEKMDPTLVENFFQRFLFFVLVDPFYHFSWMNEWKTEKQHHQLFMEKKRMMTMILNITMITTADIVQQNKKKNFHFLTQFLNPNIILESSFPLTFTLAYSIPPKTNDIDKQTQYTDTH